MELCNKQVYDFLYRLGYKSEDKDKLNGRIIDHVNKLYSKDSNIICLLIDTIFYYTPPSVYNLVKYAMEKTYNDELTPSSITYVINNSDIPISDKYREVDLVQTLHPWLNRDLQDNLKLVLEILISKAIYTYDNYFNPKCNNIPQVDINKLFEEYEIFLDKINVLNFTLSGSTVLAYYGRLYRKEIKDFDFIVESSRLDKEVLKLINHELTINKLVGKRRIELENKLKEEFMNSSIGQQLHGVFGDELKLIACMIDRISAYDYEAKATFIFKWREIEFDLLFRDNINSVLISYKNTFLNIQDINDVLYTKRLLGRPKDFQDLINFIPKHYIQNNDKCIVKYG